MPLKDRFRSHAAVDEDRYLSVAESDSASSSSSTAVTEIRSKIVIVGSSGCGKTTMIHRYMQSSFLQTYTPTGFDTYSCQYNVTDAYKIHMSIWDTSGDIGYDRVRPLSYSEADLVIICFAIDKLETVEDVVSKWYPEIQEHCPNVPVMLVGCKSDLRTESKELQADNSKPTYVSFEQGLKTAKLISALVYSETSSKNSQRSVNDVIEVAALSSAGSKSGYSVSSSHSSGTSTCNDSGVSGVNNSTGNESSKFGRQRSFIRHNRFSGVSETKVHLRKETAKSCVVM